MQASSELEKVTIGSTGETKNLNTLLRLTHLDGFRGLFLVLMVTTHFSLLFPAELQYLKYHYFGYVEDAQGFVFISGIVVGLVYGRRLLRAGKKFMIVSILNRIKTIYFYQFALILILSALSLTVWNGIGHPNMFAPFVDNPVAFPISTALLVTSAQFADILPLYLFFMAATPFILVALSRKNEKQVILVSALVWLFSQTLTIEHFATLTEHWLATHGLGFDLNKGLHTLSWQVLYVAGLCIGFRIANGTFSLKHFHSKECKQILPVVVFAAVVIAIADIAENFGYADYLSSSFSGASSRNDFPIIYVANFAIDAYLVVWLVVAGQHARLAIVRALSKALNWLVQLKLFVTVGRHSIWIYSCHVVFLYVWAAFADGVTPGFFARNAIFALVGLSLYPLALFEDRLKVFGAHVMNLIGLAAGHSTENKADTSK